MAYCNNCAAQVQDGIKFCPSCGKSITANGPAPGYEPPVMPGAPQQANIRDAQENKTMAILAYILFFIPLLTGAHKSSPFAKFHTNQGTVLFIAGVAWSIVYSILAFILAFIPYIGWALAMLIGLLSFIFLVFAIMGIVNAVNGVMKPLPLIGKFTVIK